MDYKARIEAHNKEIDDYRAYIISVIGEKSDFHGWVKAQQMFKAQNFWDKGIKILEEARADGLNVTIDGQSHKLYLKG